MALPRSCSAAALTLLVAAGAGCGSPATRPTADQPADVARAFVADCARGQPELANHLLTPRARSALADAGSGRAACLRFLRFTDGAGHLSDAEQRAMLRRASVKPARAGNSAQFAIVTIRAPGPRRQQVQLERRADEWLLTRPLPPDKLEKVQPKRAARNAAVSFRQLCRRHEYDSAENLLADSARRDFEHTGAKADACLKFLGLTKPKEDISPSEQDQLLADADVADISEVKRTSAKVTITAPLHGSADVEAKDQGGAWRLTKPSGSPEDAAKSLLDSCAHEQYETAADLLVATARTHFREHGGKLDACLQLLSVGAPRTDSDATSEAMIDDAEISRVKADGEDAAAVMIRVPKHGPRQFRAERHDDEWKLDPTSAPG